MLRTYIFQASPVEVVAESEDAAWQEFDLVLRELADQGLVWGIVQVEPNGQYCPTDGSILWTDDLFERIYACGDCGTDWWLDDDGILAVYHRETE